MYLVLQFDETGDLGFARPAPRRPEVQQDHLALVGAERDVLAFEILDREIEVGGLGVGIAGGPARIVSLAGRIGMGRHGREAFGRRPKRRGAPLGLDVVLPHEGDADREERDQGCREGSELHLGAGLLVHGIIVHHPEDLMPSRAGGVPGPRRQPTGGSGPAVPGQLVLAQERHLVRA